MGKRVAVQHLRVTGQHHDVAPASVPVEMQAHTGTNPQVGQAIRVRTVVDQEAGLVPEEPHRVRLRRAVRTDRHEPGHLLLAQPLANPLTKGSCRIRQEVRGHETKARRPALL
jgi:hypothetical protein